MILDSDKFVIELDRLREPKVISFGEAFGNRVIVIRSLKSVLEACRIQTAEARRATGKGFDTVARPRYQKGYLFQRDGKYVLRYREPIIQNDGTIAAVHRAVTLGSFAKKKDAQRTAEAHLRSLNCGSIQPQAVMTFREFWDLYFVTQVFPSLKFSTQRLYKSLARRHLVPAFGNRRLNEIARVQIQQFITLKMQAGLSVQTLAHLRNLLSKVFSTAMSWGWLQDNSARGVKLPPREPVRERRVLNQSEIESLVPALTDPIRSIFLIALLADLRIGEVLALEVQDADLVNARLHVRRDVYCGHLGSPKTPRSERQVPIGPLLMSAIRTWLAKRPGPSMWLFPSEAGTPFHDRNLLCRNLWPVCDTLGIRRFTWHVLRRTFLTTGGNTGQPLPVMASIAGHSSIETTMRYILPNEAVQRKTVRKIEKVLCSNVLKNEASEATPGKAKVLIQ